MRIVRGTHLCFFLRSWLACITLVPQCDPRFERSISVFLLFLFFFFSFLRYCCVSFLCIFQFIFEYCLNRKQTKTRLLYILKDEEIFRRKTSNRMIARPLFISLRPILIYCFFRHRLFWLFDIMKEWISYEERCRNLFPDRTSFFSVPSVESIWNLMLYLFVPFFQFEFIVISRSRDSILFEKKAFSLCFLSTTFFSYFLLSFILVNFYSFFRLFVITYPPT